MKKALNLILALSLTAVVGLSFFSTGTEASARMMMRFTDVICWDIAPGTQTTSTIPIRVCGLGSSCPWKWIEKTPGTTQGSCTLSVE